MDMTVSVDQGLTAGSVTLSVAREGGGRRLRAVAPVAELLRAFQGSRSETAEGSVIVGPLSPENAAAVRQHAPWLSPRPLGQSTSAGVGDRLGLATVGHVRAFRRHGEGVAAVFAQQSAREMERLGRSPQEVLDDATFGCVQAGWTLQVGADADHLKTTSDIDSCLDAGFSMFTLDPGDHVRIAPDAPGPDDLAQVPWNHLEDDLDSLRRRYAGTSLDLGDSARPVEEVEVVRAAVKYGAAVAHTVAMYRHLLEAARSPVEVEVAVDEIDEVTTVFEHHFMVSELSRLGVRLVSFAPRYVGGFEKGVEYVGEPSRFAASFAQHAHLARTRGPYKLSLHSGSDKYSIYEQAVAATDGLIHLKTSGTSYLEALVVAAECEPSLFREIYRLSREAYREAKASYHVSARLDRAPEPDALVDASLVDLVTSPDTRQILHVGYGAVLTDRDSSGRAWIDQELRRLLHREAERYAGHLETHIGQHLKHFARSS